MPAAHRLIDRLDHWIERVLHAVSALLILALTAVILYAVVARYFFNHAPSWSEEVPRVIFLWASYLAIAVAMKRGQTLQVRSIINRFPRGVRLGIELFMHASIFVMLAFLVWWNQPVIALNSTTKMLATQWSDALRYWPLTVGCVLMALYQVRLVIKSIDDYRGAAPS